MANLNYIKGKLKRFKGFKVSSELNGKIMSAIGNEKLVLDYDQSASFSIFTYLTQITMDIFKRYAVAIVAVMLVISGVMYFNQNSYAYHLSKAKYAMQKLENLLEGNPNQLSLIQSAFAEEGNDVLDELIEEGDKTTKDSSEFLANENELVNLVEDIVEETEDAIEAAEEIGSPKELGVALGEIGDVQDEQIDLLVDAVGAVESDKATDAVTEALKTTEEEQKLVDEALNFVEEAEEAGEDEVNIDIDTEDEEDRSLTDSDSEEEVIEADTQYLEAKQVVEDLKVAGASDEELEKLEIKLAKVEQALGDGKVGRVHGLTTAIQAKSRNMARRKTEKVVEKVEKNKNSVRGDFEDVVDGNIIADEFENLNGDWNIEINIDKEKGNPKKPSIPKRGFGGGI